MKRWLYLLLTLCLLSACQAAQDPAPPDPPVTPDPPPKEDIYDLVPLTGGGSSDNDDGVTIARYSYSLVQMTAPENASEAAQAKVAAFNEKMLALQESLETSGQSLAKDAHAAQDAGYAFSADSCYTETTTATVEVMGNILSVKMDGYSYAGGNHPNVWSYSYMFDWAQGTYIDPVEAADDPEGFRAAVTDKLLDQIMGLDPEVLAGYFTGYEDAVSRWNEYCAVFKEAGLEVTFATYELGPYALGEQVFTLSYQEIGEALGPAGQARLGLTGETG